MITLSPYQDVSRDFLVERRRGMLLDSPGVGKTFPAVAGARSCKDYPPWLVTAPAYLLPTWKREIQRHSPLAKVVIANGTPTERMQALESVSDFVLTSYNNWSNARYPALHKREWNFIFDEAHRLRGRNSLWTKQVLKLLNATSVNKNSRYWLLTGTPLVRDPGDVFPLLRLMDPKRFRSYWHFVGEWCELNVTPWATEVGQLKAGLEDKFWAMVSEYSLRRSTADILELQDLTSTYTEITVDLPASVRKTMKDAVKNWTIEHPDLETVDAVSSGGALVQKLRQMTSVPPTKANPKLDALEDLLEDHKEPVIVWCWYRATANAVFERFGSKRVCIRFTGDESAEKKQRALECFKLLAGSKEGPIIVATISAMKEGVNLQEARTQIFLEESYLPSDNEQAVARSKRRGQTQPVNVYHIHANDSLDIKVHAQQASREAGILRAMLEYTRKDFL